MSLLTKINTSVFLADLIKLNMLYNHDMNTFHKSIKCVLSLSKLFKMQNRMASRGL